MSDIMTPNTPDHRPRRTDRWTVDLSPTNAQIARASESFNEHGLGPIEDGYAPAAVAAADHMGRIIPSQLSLVDPRPGPKPVPVVPDELGLPREYPDGGVGHLSALFDLEPQLLAAYCTAAHVGPDSETLSNVIYPYEAEGVTDEAFPREYRDVASMLAYWVGDLVGPDSRWARHPILGHPNVYAFVRAWVTEAFFIGRVAF